jgi:type I restriction enzyme S subunit
MQGKLVEQNPDDEPASELLKRIKIEKEQLIKNGKIKKEKTLPPITEDEIPFEIPQGWDWVRFQEILDVRDGTHDSPKYQQTGYPFVTSKNLNNGTLDFSNIQYISKEDFLKFSARSYVENDDILFAMIGSIGNPVIVKKDREFSIKNVALFKKSNFISIKFLYYYLLYLQDILRNNATGAVQAFVSLSLLRLSLFPLPPLAEQQRIVEKLEQILPLIDEYGKNEEKLSQLNKTLPEKLKQSILQHAVQGKLVPQNPTDEPASELLKRIKVEKEQLIKDGKIKKEKPLPPITQDEIPYKLPQGWEWVRLSDICNIIMGQSPNGNTVTTIGKGIEFHQGKVFFGNKYLKVSNQITTKPTKIAEINSILLCVRAPVGKINITDRNICIGRGLCGIKSYIEISTEFLYYLLLNYEDIFVKQATGTTFVAITGDVIKRQIVPLPPLAEQQRIVAKVDELLFIVEKIKG